MVHTKTERPASESRTHTMRVSPETWSRGELLAVAMSRTASDILRHTSTAAPVPTTASVLRVALDLGLERLETDVARESEAREQK
jgi:hypothetical protein